MKREAFAEAFEGLTARADRLLVRDESSRIYPKCNDKNMRDDGLDIYQMTA